jgi:hypothetical protein
VQRVGAIDIRLAHFQGGRLEFLDIGVAVSIISICRYLVNLGCRKRRGKLGGIVVVNGLPVAGEDSAHDGRL